MKVTAAIARQLQRLCVDPVDADRFIRGLTDLGAGVARVVPSCTSVSVTVSVAGSAAPVTIGIQSVGAGPVRASMAVPRSLMDPADVVLFQASEPGAFLMLAADLGVASNPLLLPRIDEHLDVELDVSARDLRGALDELSAVNRAVGVLVDRGFAPADAHAELARRARQDGTDLAGAGRLLLDSIEGPPAADRC